LASRNGDAKIHSRDALFFSHLANRGEISRTDYRCRSAPLFPPSDRGPRRKRVRASSTQFCPNFSGYLIALSRCEFTRWHLPVRKVRGAGGVIGARELPMTQFLARFWKDQSAATAIEYGLIAAGISVVIIAAVNGIGTTLNTTFGSISTQLK
jgi:pilus assembly protein Flp/PilA